MNRPISRGRTVGSLLGLEFRRVRKQVLHTVGGAIAAVGLVALAGLDSSTTGFIAVAVGLSFVVMGPMHVLKDKLDGTMEFLAGLPATPASLALARCAAASGLTALGAFFVTAACGIVLPPILNTPAIRVVIVAYPLAWFSASAASWLLIGLTTRYTVARLASIGLVAPLVALVGVLWVFDRLFGSPLDVVTDVMARDSGPAILVSAILLSSALVMAASFGLARDGIARYRPEPDKVDW